jgi:hypothetical protein
MNISVSIAEIKIGNAAVQFEIPTSLFDVISEHLKHPEIIKLYSYNSDQITDMLRKLIPEEVKPPSRKQETYAKSIASALNLQLTDRIMKNASACSQFLDNHQIQYKEIQDQIKSRKKENSANTLQATRIHRWLGAQEMLNKGISIEQVAAEYGVKPTTIEKYCDLLYEWKIESKKDGSFSLMKDLVNRLRSGEDISVI